MGYNNIFGIDIDEMQTLKAKEKGLEIENISALDYFEKIHICLILCLCLMS
jgi:hypothetical protein